MKGWNIKPQNWQEITEKPPTLADDVIDWTEIQNRPTMEELRPDHQWSGTSLQFETAAGSWGSLVDLKGDQGIQGIQGIQGETGLSGTFLETNQRLKLLGSHNRSFLSDIYQGIEISGPSSNFLVLVEDGTGRARFLWNATPGINNTFIAAETAMELDFDPLLRQTSGCFSIKISENSPLIGELIQWKQLFYITLSGIVGIPNCPASSTGLNAGEIYRSSDGTLKIAL